MWNITAWQCISPEVTVKGVTECCMSNVVDGTDGEVLWNGSAEDGSGVKMKALTVNMETVTLTDKGR